MTNLEKIKTLSDDKMIQVITNICCETCIIICGSKDCNNNNCEEGQKNGY